MDDNNSNQDDGLNKILKDMMKDLLTTFPELADNLDVNLKNILCDENVEDSVENVRNHLKSKLPERFFDILYENNDMFENEENDLAFLPGIDFSVLWRENISDNTRKTIWKYLQLLLFTTVNDVSNEDTFGDTAKLFQAINEEEFRTKLESTIDDIQSMFNDSSNNMGEISGNTNIPDAGKIHEHVSYMMNGKIGLLAKEIAEETSKELDIDLENVDSVNDVFKKLFKNPANLMDLVKNVKTKLDDKLKSGDIKESELISEATELMGKMKDMPGMGNLQEMLTKLGGGGGKTKMNINAMRSNLERNMKMAQQRERMRNRVNKKQENEVVMTNEEYNERARAADKAMAELLKEETQLNGLDQYVFKSGEKPMKSSKKKKKRRRKKKN